MSPAGVVYAISFDDLFIFDPAENELDFVTSFELPTAVGFHIGADGVGYLSSKSVERIFSLNLSNGATDLVLPGTSTSDGDLFVEGDSVFVSTNDDTIERYSLASGQLEQVRAHQLASVFGLGGLDDREVVLGYSNRSLYSIDPAGVTEEIAQVIGGTSAFIFGAAHDIRTDVLGTEEARTVAYLYEAGLDRNGAIDAQGLNFWIDRREDRLSARDLAERFLQSDEFEGAFGSPDTLSDRELVEVLYRNVLDREGETGGVDFWTGRVGDPSFTRPDLLLAFAVSPENVAGSPQVQSLEEVFPGEWDFA